MFFRQRKRLIFWGIVLILANKQLRILSNAKWKFVVDFIKIQWNKTHNLALFKWKEWIGSILLFGGVSSMSVARAMARVEAE